MRAAIQEWVLPEFDKLRLENAEIRSTLQITNRLLDDMQLQLVDLSHRLDETNKRIDESNKRMDRLHEMSAQRVLSLLLALCCLFGGVALAQAPVGPNVASQVELETLPGIGPAKARAIIEYREKHGPFRRVEDLEGVRGIGRATVEKLAPRVKIAPPRATRAQ